MKLTELFSQTFFVEGAFRIFDKDRSGSVSLEEFLETMHQFALQGDEEKLSFLFKVFIRTINLLTVIWLLRFMIQMVTELSISPSSERSSSLVWRRMVWSLTRLR